MMKSSLILKDECVHHFGFAQIARGPWLFGFTRKFHPLAPADMFKSQAHHFMQLFFIFHYLVQMNKNLKTGRGCTHFI